MPQQLLSGCPHHPAHSTRTASHLAASTLDGRASAMLIGFGAHCSCCGLLHAVAVTQAKWSAAEASSLWVYGSTGSRGVAEASVGRTSTPCRLLWCLMSSISKQCSLRCSSLHCAMMALYNSPRHRRQEKAASAQLAAGCLCPLWRGRRSRPNAQRAAAARDRRQRYWRLGAGGGLPASSPQHQQRLTRQPAIP